MITVVIALHNLMRWLVVALGIWAVARAYLGLARPAAWTPLDRKAGLFFTIAFDIQFLIGLLLYFALSPLTRAALSDFSSVMASADLRFFALDHPLGMLIAIVLAHLGSGLSRKADGDRARHGRAAALYTLSLAVVVLSIPWSRPLLPSLG